MREIQPEVLFVSDDSTVPSKTSSYKKNSKTGDVEPKPSSPRTQLFETELKKVLKTEFGNNSAFPTKKYVFVSVLHGFHSKKAYENHDLDNLAKTVLDALKGAIYYDDGQVEMLWTRKEFLQKAQESFYCISVKILDNPTRKRLVNGIGSFA